MKNAEIAAAIAAGCEERKERIRVETDELERQAECLATSDVRQLLKDGLLLPLHEIPDELAPAIASIEVVTRNKGEGEIEHVAKIRFWDKPSALALLFKLRGHGHFNEKQIKGDVTVRSGDEQQRELKELTRYLSDEDLKTVAAKYQDMVADLKRRKAEIGDILEPARQHYQALVKLGRRPYPAP